MFVLIALALAADVPVLVLPPGQDPAAWRAPAALAGLVVGPGGAGARVEIVQGSSGWVVVARSGSDEKRSPIAAPVTSQAREDAVWLGMGLLRSLPQMARPEPPTVAKTPPPKVAPPPVKPGLPPPAPPPPKPPAPRAPTPPSPPVLPPEAPAVPAPAAVAPAEAAPAEVAPALVAPTLVAPVSAPAEDPIGEAPEPDFLLAGGVDPVAPDDERAEALVSAPTRAPPPWTAWATAGPAIALRPATAVGLGGQLSAGLHHQAAWFGVGARWVGERALPDIPDAALDPSVDVQLAAWWSPALPVAPILGATAGISTRGYRQGTTEIDRFVVPLGAAELGASVRVAPPLDLLLVARAAVDGAVTLSVTGDQDPVALSPWELGLHFSIRGSIP